jgi:hypothetical protein
MLDSFTNSTLKRKRLLYIQIFYNIQFPHFRKVFKISCVSRNNKAVDVRINVKFGHFSLTIFALEKQWVLHNFSLGL